MAEEDIHVSHRKRHATRVVPGMASTQSNDSGNATLATPIPALCLLALPCLSSLKHTYLIPYCRTQIPRLGAQVVTRSSAIGLLLSANAGEPT